jgi:lipopolysaccharide/colanic/teichoic acid biosynthesis glycosyltransferase
MITKIAPTESGLNLMHDNYGIDARADRVTLQRPQAMAAGEVEVPAYFARKTVWTRLLGAVLLVLLSPIMLLIMLLVRLTSPGAALFRQTRLGRDGRTFNIFKIRTMYRDAEAVSGPALCQPGDSRMTPVGRVLRLFHLDELPQLINVVRGEMCLVGPRPERPEIIARNRLCEKVPRFSERTKVLPGVTGLAQINLPADVDAESVIPKVELDLEYIETATAGLDFRILACTSLRMLGVRHGRAVRLFGVERKVPVRRGIERAEMNLSNGNGAHEGAMEHGPRRPKIRATVFAATSTNGDHNGFISPSASTPCDIYVADVKETNGRTSAAALPSHRPR